MTVLRVLLFLLVVFFLIGRIRLGGMVEYAAQGLLAKLRIGQIWIQVYPLKKKNRAEKAAKKTKKSKKEKPCKDEPDREPEHKAGGTLELVKRYLPLVGEAAGGMRKRITIDRLILDLTVATQDAAGTAMAYGYANAAIGMLWPIFEQNFKVKEHRLRTAVDFTSQSMTIYLNAAISIRIGQLFNFAVRLLWCFLRIYKKSKREK